MEASLSASPKRGSVPITYTARHKRKRSAAGPAQSPEDQDQEKEEESEGTGEEDSPIKIVPAVSPRSILAAKKSADRIVAGTPKKVELALPGPSPKRARHEHGTPDSKTGASGPVTGSTSLSSHRRNMSSISISSLSTPSRAPKPHSNMGSSRKPPSSVGRGSMKPPSEDDAESVADSMVGSKKRKSEAERKEFFEQDEQCDKVEEHRAMCKKCGDWVPLSEKQSYTIGPWMKHTRRCGKDASKKDAEVDDTEDGASVAPSTTSAVRRTEEERKAYLEADSCVQEVKPHEVLCRVCDKWIRLSVKTKYTLANWMTHRARCSGSVPSSRVATAERKLALVNDAQAKSFDTHSVECVGCGESVKLEGEGDYNLLKWEEHKTACSLPEATDRGQKPTSAGTVPPPAAPPSVASVSTETTVVAGSPDPEASHKATSEGKGTVSTNSSPSRLGKRARTEDEDGEDGEGEERGSERRKARTEGYTAPEGDAPGVWDWMMLPWKCFVRGWKLGSGESPASKRVGAAAWEDHEAGR